MPKLKDLIDELVTANRILANEGIVDSFGHVSVRHPEAQGPLSAFPRPRARADRSRRHHGVHAGRRSDRRARRRTSRPTPSASSTARSTSCGRRCMSVVHNHSPATIPFGITGTKMKPIMHMCASIGHEVPLWDSHDKFGDTDAAGQQHGDGPRSRQEAGQGPHRADARPRRVVAGNSIRARGVHLHLSRVERQAADAGRWRWARSSFSTRARSTP